MVWLASLASLKSASRLAVIRWLPQPNCRRKRAELPTKMSRIADKNEPNCRLKCQLVSVGWRTAPTDLVFSREILPTHSARSYTCITLWAVLKERVDLTLLYNRSLYFRPEGHPFMSREVANVLKDMASPELNS